MSFKKIPINAARVVEGLSKIGYTPWSAICDVIDNSVQAEAKHVWVEVIRSSERSDSAKNNVKEYIIIDDGKGMDSKTIEVSLELGSSDGHYPNSSLSKFGLGLKSASFSMGEVLSVISRADENKEFKKYTVSLPEIRLKNTYGIIEDNLDDVDKSLIKKYISKESGSIIRIQNVKKVNHPAIKKTLKHLAEKIGVIYYYFMQEDGLKIEIDGSQVSKLDPLFSQEASQNGDLDELIWDGKKTMWLQRPTEIILDADNKVKATIEATHLPHPPTFKKIGNSNLQKETREKYNIAAGNYGFYVYRNKRLIAWAERFDGMIGADQDYYALRGRLTLNSEADEVLNIDVKKSRIILSDEAFDQIDYYASELKRKAKKAWGLAKKRVRNLSKSDAADIANQIASETVFPDELPGEDDDEKSLTEKKKREVKINANTSGKGKDKPTSTETNDFANQKIKIVDLTDDNLLWQMYYDASNGTSVKINRHHRFSRLIYDQYDDNKVLKVIFDNLLYTLVEAEKHTIKATTEFEDEVISKILQQFREVATQYLSKTAQNISKQLSASDL